MLIHYSPDESTEKHIEKNLEVARSMYARGVIGLDDVRLNIMDAFTKFIFNPNASNWIGLLMRMAIYQDIYEDERKKRRGPPTEASFDRQKILAGEIPLVVRSRPIRDPRIDVVIEDIRDAGNNARCGRGYDGSV